MHFGVRLTDLANKKKNLGCPVRFEFQKHNKQFLA